MTTEPLLGDGTPYVEGMTVYLNGHGYKTGPKHKLEVIDDMWTITGLPLAALDSSPMPWLRRKLGYLLGERGKLNKQIAEVEAEIEKLEETPL